MLKCYEVSGVSQQEDCSVALQKMPVLDELIVLLYITRCGAAGRESRVSKST